MRAVMRLSAIVIVLLTAGPTSAQTDDIWRAGARISVVASEDHDVWVAGALVSVRGAVRR